MDSRSINDWGQACCEPHENCPRNNAPTKPTPTGARDPSPGTREATRLKRINELYDAGRFQQVLEGLPAWRAANESPENALVLDGWLSPRVPIHALPNRCSPSIATRSPTAGTLVREWVVLSVNRKPLISILDIYLYPESLADKNPHFPESALREKYMADAYVRNMK